MPKYKHEYKQVDVSRREGEGDAAYYRRLAKQADQRLVRLEKLAEKEGFESVTQYAYRSAVRELTLNFGASEKTPRFNTKLPTAKDGGIIQEYFNEKLAVLKDFLTSPTSTKRGIIDVYQQRADTLNKNTEYNTNFTWQDMADFFESGQAERLFKEYGSKTVLKAIGTIQNTKDLPSTVLKNLNMKVSEKEKDAMLDILRHRSDYVDIGKRGSATRIKLRNMINRM